MRSRSRSVESGLGGHGADCVSCMYPQNPTNLVCEKPAFMGSMCYRDAVSPCRIVRQNTE